MSDFTATQLTIVSANSVPQLILQNQSFLSIDGEFLQLMLFGIATRKSQS